MDAIKNLPLPLRIGIPAAVVIIIAVMVFFGFMRKPAPVRVLKTQDNGIYQAAQAVLEAKGIPFVKNSDSVASSFEITVSPNAKTAASDALAQSGIKDLSGTAEKIDCPAPPGFTATKAANDRANNCEDAKSVQGMLLTAGASAANVKVSQMASDTLLGPETTKLVLAQVFLSPTMEDSWPADQAARAIATAVGTSIDRVTITDSKLQTLFDGSRGSASPSAMSAGVGSGAACKDMATATEIASKEAAVRSCYKDTISDEISRLVGGSDRFVLTVDAKIEASSRTTQRQSNRPGPVREQSTQRGGDSNMTDTSRDPNTVTTSTVKPAGDIAKLALTVSLDSNYVDERQELAVKQLLSTYVDRTRKDPAPTVTRIAFSPGAGKKTDNKELEAIRAAANLPTSESDRRVQTITETKMPTALLAMIGVIVVALLGAIAFLWQRASSAAAERARYEQEFQQQQRVLDTYAQQDPDAIARDLEALFGAPAATNQDRALT